MYKLVIGMFDVLQSYNRRYIYGACKWLSVLPLYEHYDCFLNDFIDITGYKFFICLQVY